MHYQTADVGTPRALSGWAIAGLIVALVVLIILVCLVLFNRPPPPPPTAAIKNKTAILIDINEAPVESGNTLAETPAQTMARPYVSAANNEPAVTTGADLVDDAAAPAVAKGRPLYSLDPNSSSSSSSDYSMSDYSLSE